MGLEDLSTGRFVNIGRLIMKRCFNMIARLREPATERFMGYCLPVPRRVFRGLQLNPPFHSPYRLFWDPWVLSSRCPE